MLVSSLEVMEEIVSNHESLSWDGWDVVRHIPNHNAVYSKDAEYRDGQWNKKRVFPITEKGWHIPNQIGRNYAQVEG